MIIVQILYHNKGHFDMRRLRFKPNVSTTITAQFYEVHKNING